MMKILQKLLQEPLVSFLLLGFVLYLYYDSVSLDDVALDTKIEISVTPSEIQTLQKVYTKKYQKSMSDEELSLYVEDTYKKKVLLEESTRLNLHKSDAVVAKRLVEKMEYILLGSVAYKEPNESELHEYYMQNIEEYSNVKSLSFKHIYFSNTKNNIDELHKMLHLSKFDVKKVKNLGEPFDGYLSYENISYSQVEEKFGNYFALNLFKLKSGVWSQGIHSKYGVHLVYVTSKTSTQAYKFDEVEDRVYEDYLKQRRDTIVGNAYKNILENYTLRLEKQVDDI